MNDKLIKIYTELLSSYNPQGWWPVTQAGELIPVYSQNNNLTKKQKLEVCFGAILTQNTSWKNVEKAIIELNKNDLIDIDKIISIPQNELAELIKPSGYFNQKAERLKIFCTHIKNNYCGDLSILFKKEIGELREELLSIKGIGNETADSIILYSAQKPIFVVDAYTKRIFSRLGIIKEDNYVKIQEQFHKLKKDAKMFNEYHALIVEHAKRYCIKKPECDDCPLNTDCEKNCDN